MVLALPLHRDSFPEGYGWYHGGVFGRCGCRILLRFPIAEALKRLTGPRTCLLPPADSGRDRLFGRSLAAARGACGRPRGPPFGTAALERGNPSSNVVLKVRPAVSYSWVGDQDFTHRVRETDGDWPAVSQLASVVVQLGQAEDVPRDLFDGCLTMLNIDPQRDRSLPAVIRSQPRLEPRCVKESRAIVYLQERPPQDGHATDAKESGAVTIASHPNPDQLTVGGACILEARKLLAIDR